MPFTSGSLLQKVLSSAEHCNTNEVGHSHFRYAVHVPSPCLHILPALVPTQGAALSECIPCSRTPALLQLESSALKRCKCASSHLPPRQPCCSSWGHSCGLYSELHSPAFRHQSHLRHRTELVDRTMCILWTSIAPPQSSDTVLCYSHQQLYLLSTHF